MVVRQIRNGILIRHQIGHADFDVGSGRTTGFYCSGREDPRTPLEKALAGVAGLGVTVNPADALYGTDFACSS